MPYEPLHYNFNAQLGQLFIKHSQGYYEALHAMIANDKPAGIVFGPFLFLGCVHWFSPVLTKVAFKLLKLAGWKMIASEVNK